MMNLSTLKSIAQARMVDTISGLRSAAVEHAPEAVKAREAGFSIKNAAGDEAVIRIYDEIWWLGVNAADLTAELDRVSAPRILVEINSPGGDVFDGLTIYNALRNHPAHVTTRVDGVAASIASIIAQAGDTRLVQDSAQIMIHNAWGMTVGDNRDHADMAALLAQQDGLMADIYARHGTGDASHFRELMNAETWMTAEQAVAEGLADAIHVPPAKESPQDAARPTLRAQIDSTVEAVEATITSAERVAALRTDAGKELSNTITDGLAGLRASLDRLDGLLHTPSDDTAEATGPLVSDAWLSLMERRHTFA